MSKKESIQGSIRRKDCVGCPERKAELSAHNQVPPMRPYNKREIIIGFISDIDLNDIRLLSGTSFYLRKTLEQNGFKVVCIDKLANKFTPARLILKIYAKFLRRLFGLNYLIDWTKPVAKGYARAVKKAEKKNDPDVFFAWHTPCISFLKTSKPVVLFTDATFKPMVGFYEQFSNLPNSVMRRGDSFTRRALEKCALLIFSSEWAAQSAVNDYGADPSKVRVVALGANIESNRNKEDIKAIMNQKSSNLIRLLFMGVDWRRKGGDKALAVCEELNRRGYHVRLDIVGTTPPNAEKLPDHVNIHGFISKTSEEGKKRLEKLITESHFLILPTMADCTPMVIAEFNSFGIPVITTNVGGIPSIIKDNINGMKFPSDSHATAMADYIVDTISNMDKYRALALSSFEEFQMNLSWEKSGKKLASLITDVLKSKD